MGYEAWTPTGGSHPHGMAPPWWRPCRDLAASVGVRHVLSRPAARPGPEIAARTHIASTTAWTV
jgi:hypothetical protein